MANYNIIKDSENKEYAEIDVKNTGETDGGAVWFHDGDKSFCVPKSLMEDWPDVGYEGTAMVELWFAIKEEII